MGKWRDGDYKGGGVLHLHPTNPRSKEQKKIKRRKQ